MTLVTLPDPISLPPDVFKKTEDGDPDNCIVCRTPLGGQRSFAHLKGGELHQSHWECFMLHIQKRREQEFTECCPTCGVSLNMNAPVFRKERMIQHVKNFALAGLVSAAVNAINIPTYFAIIPSALLALNIGSFITQTKDHRTLEFIGLCHLVSLAGFSMICVHNQYLGLARREESLKLLRVVHKVTSLGLSPLLLKKLITPEFWGAMTGVLISAYARSFFSTGVTWM
ncbi:MAG TPA: hypothetical protein VLG44_07030 [Chlamydiales bacterium]|nr:hypothetical protein [Chlamydiales bacterium]